MKHYFVFSIYCDFIPTNQKCISIIRGRLLSSVVILRSWFRSYYVIIPINIVVPLSWGNFSCLPSSTAHLELHWVHISIDGYEDLQLLRWSVGTKHLWYTVPYRQGNLIELTIGRKQNSKYFIISVFLPPIHVYLKWREKLLSMLPHTAAWTNWG